MDEAAMVAVLEGSVAEVTMRLDELDTDALTRLRGLEVAGENRKTLLSVIDGRIAHLAEHTDPAPTGDGGKVARGEQVAAAPAPPPWKAPDYTGPLTIEQAMWRNEQVVTK